MSRRKPPKGGRGAAPTSRRQGSRRRKGGGGGRALLWLVVGLGLLALGAYFAGDTILARLSSWRAPAPYAAPAPRSNPSPARATQPMRAEPEKRRTASTPPPVASPAPPASGTAPDAAPAGAGEAPAPPQSEVRSLPTAAQPKAWIAIVIDDLGRDVDVIERLTTIAAGVQLSYAVLPYEPRTSEVVEALRRHGAEVLLHLPMDPEGGADPGPGALSTSMSKRELVAATEAALAAVPGAVGVNNHMGSKLSADRAAMTAILGELRREGRYFLDSRTTAGSVGFEVARELGVPAASRDLFLDDDSESSAIAGQFARLLARAREQGAAIALAHPRPSTLAILARELPRAAADGFEFVPVSYLLERSEELPE